MAKIYCWHGGSNTAPYDTKAKAATTFATALAAATTDGDYLLVHKAHTETRVADVIYGSAASISIVCVDADAGDAPAIQTTSEGFLAGNDSFTLRGIGHSLYVYGLHIQVAGSGPEVLAIAANTSGSSIECESCVLNVSGVSSGPVPIQIGANDAPCTVVLRNCDIRFNNSATYFLVLAAFQVIGGTITGGAMGSVCVFDSSFDVSGGYAELSCVDLSGITSLTALVGDSSTTTGTARFDRCKLPSTITNWLAPQSLPGSGGNRLFVYDSHSGDVHGFYCYADGTGSVVSDFTIKRAAGVAGQSWRVTTTANCSPRTPFTTPPIAYLNDDVSTSVTLTIEILRDGSATAYTDDAVWSTFCAKVSAGSVLGTVYTTRQVLDAQIAGTAGADIATGTGLANWSGESGTAWSGVLSAPSAFTPAEIGAMSVQVSVATPSVTDLYIDPELGGV